MATLAAPAADQLSVLLVPEFMLGGFAAKDVICGTVPFLGGAGELAELPAAQPARPAQQTRARTSQQSSGPLEPSPRELRVFPQIERGESMPDPFVPIDHSSLGIAGLVCLLVASTEVDHWSTSDTKVSVELCPCRFKWPRREPHPACCSSACDLSLPDEPQGGAEPAPAFPGAGASSLSLRAKELGAGLNSAPKRGQFFGVGGIHEPVEECFEEDGAVEVAVGEAEVVEGFVGVRHGGRRLLGAMVSPLPAGARGAALLRQGTQPFLRRGLRATPLRISAEAWVSRLAVWA